MKNPYIAGFRYLDSAFRFFKTVSLYNFNPF